MKQQLRVTLAGLLLAALVPFAAQAVPISYQIDFDGSQKGPAGTGSFVYDAAADTFGGFTFRFGDVVGSIGMFATPTVLPMGSSVTQLLFETLTGEDADPLDCQTQAPLPVCRVVGVVNPPVNPQVRPLFAAAFFTSPTLSSGYNFFTLPAGFISEDNPVISTFVGQFTVRQVSEPAGAALFGLGFAALSWLRRLRKV